MRSSRQRSSCASNRPDVNNLPRGAGDSIGWCQQTRGGRRRASAAVTYLRPAKKRANLQIVTSAQVHRVVFDGKRAVAVEFFRQSGVERVDAAREVLLSAGAIGSPHLLQLSGVGGPEVLQKAGIAVRHALPGVGRNFQDHYIARMSDAKGFPLIPQRSRAADGCKGHAAPATDGFLASGDTPGATDNPIDSECVALARLPLHLEASWVR
jgi:choline dehydrogenase-like flavoprotein